MRLLALRWLVLPQVELAIRSPRFTRDSRKQAKRALGLGLIGVLLAHFGLAAAVESRRPEWRDPEYFHRQKQLQGILAWERKQGHDRPLLVVIGGSRPQMGLSPEHLGLGTGPTDPLAFDLVQSGTIPIGEWLNLSRCLASGIEPGFVLIEVLPPVLADAGPMDRRIPLVRLGAADLARLRPYQSEPDRVQREWAGTRLAPWFTLRMPLMARWGLDRHLPSGPNPPHFLWKEMKFFGWSPFYPGQWPDSRREAGLAAARGPYCHLLQHFRIEPVNDRLYREMLEACQARGIRAALFTMPESPTFRGWYPPGVHERIAEYLAGLSREFGVPVFDCWTWENDERAYMDGHHLLGPAAERFSRRFGRECVEPWLRGGRP